MYYLGCDPDLHVLSIAVISDEGGVPVLSRVYLTKAKGSRNEAAVLDILSRSLFDKAHKPEAFLQVDAPFYSYVDNCAVAVESQDVSYTGRTNSARVSDLVTLAQVAGGVCVRLQFLVPRMQLLVKPQAWKGSVPKHIHQCRTLKKLGIEYDMAGGASPYPVPRGLDGLVVGDKVNKGDWKDINDSIGLALYARERWLLKGDR